MDQNKDNILLSICIPTYNRAIILGKTLDTYVNDPAFDNRIEIVISDNCSTDETKEVVDEFKLKFANISYYRNDENIKDLNFIKALSLGRGLYLKLMNDTVTFKEGALRFMLDVLSKKSNDMKPIFFYQNITFLNSNHIVYCSDLNDLVSNVSFWITWIANFGIWRKDFISLENKDRLTHLHFAQSDWTLRVIYNNKYGIIQFGDYYNVAELKNKGGYNVFKTFGINYLSIYSEYINSGILYQNIFHKEKIRLFKYYLIPITVTYLTSINTKYTFKTVGGLSILFKSYWYYPYFYIGMFKLGVLLIVNIPIIKNTAIYQKIKPIIKRQLRFLLD